MLDGNTATRKRNELSVQCFKQAVRSQNATITSQNRARKAKVVQGFRHDPSTFQAKARGNQCRSREMRSEQIQCRYSSAVEWSGLPVPLKVENKDFFARNRDHASGAI